MCEEFLPNSRRRFEETDEQWLARRANIVETASRFMFQQYLKDLMLGDQQASEVSTNLMGKYDIQVCTQVDEEDTATPEYIDSLIEGIDIERSAHEILVLQGDRECILEDIELALILLQINSVPEDPFK